MGVASLIGQSRPTCEISSGCTVLTGSLRPHNARARAFFYGREIQPGIGDNLIMVFSLLSHSLSIA